MSSKPNPFAAFCRSFTFAARGLRQCLKERNFRFHLTAGFYVLVMARHFVKTAGEWALLFLTVGLVIAAEAFNTALEHAVDAVCPDYNKHAEIAKDAAAGAVLVCALAALAVACVLFLRGEAWETLFALWRVQWWRPTILVLSLTAALYAVFRK